MQRCTRRAKAWPRLSLPRLTPRLRFPRSACWSVGTGKKRFDKAVEQLQDAAEVDVRYHAYIIDHGTAPQGEDSL